TCSSKPNIRLSSLAWDGTSWSDSRCRTRLIFGGRSIATRWRSCERPARFIHVTTFPPPDFSQPQFASFPDARFAPAPADGVLPDGFFSTTNLPTFVRIDGKWIAPREPRMDSGIIKDRDGVLWVREGRRLEKGDLVAVGDREDGSDGI